MMQLTIEALKPEYAVLKEAIESSTTCDKDVCMGALDDMCMQLILCATSYQGIESGHVVAVNAEKDMSFVCGELTKEEEQERIEWHYSRIAEQCE